MTWKRPAEKPVDRWLGKSFGFLFHLYVAQALFAVGCFACGCVLGGLRYAPVVLHGASAEGVVVRYERTTFTSGTGSTRSTRTGYLPWVEFGVDGRTVRFRDFWSRERSAAKYEAVRVLYDPVDPAVAMIDKGIRNWMPWMPFFGVAAFLGFVSLRTWMKSRDASARAPGWLATVASLLVAPLLALAVVVVSGRGSRLPIMLDVVFGVVACVAALAVSPRKHVVAGVVCLLEVVAFSVFLATYTESPLPAPDPYRGRLPSASPPPEMRAYRLATGSNHRTAAFAYRGGSFAEPREFAMTAVLLRHPRGDILIDAGFGSRVAEHLARMPLGFRLSTDYSVTRPAAQQLAAAGYDRSRLHAVLLTHAHWDHVSGVPDLGAVPVLVPHAEQHYVAHSGWIGEVARTSGARFETYAFDGGPYLGFPSSHDLYGDGAIVAVPAPGHTPGSVVVFVTLPGPRRYAFIGDLAWQLEGITEREERPWLVRVMGDDDPLAVRENLLRMAALHAKFPELTIVPAHDPRGFASFADLPSRFE